jgi:hypothetical protein
MHSKLWQLMQLCAWSFYCWRNSFQYRVNRGWVDTRPRFALEKRPICFLCQGQPQPNHYTDFCTSHRWSCNKSIQFHSCCGTKVMSYLEARFFRLFTPTAEVISCKQPGRNFCPITREVEMTGNTDWRQNTLICFQSF